MQNQRILMNMNTKQNILTVKVPISYAITGTYLKYYKYGGVPIPSTLKNGYIITSIYAVKTSTNAYTLRILSTPQLDYISVKINNILYKDIKQNVEYNTSTIDSKLYSYFAENNGSTILISLYFD